MTYYKTTFKVPDLGCVPQNEGLIGNCHVDSPNHLWKFAYSDQIEGLWVPEGIKIRYRAKFSDILNCVELSHPYLVMSNKFFEVISKLILPKFLYFPINAIKKDKTAGYNIFISKEVFAEYIDFGITSFFISSFKNGAPFREPIEIKEINEYWKNYRSMKEGTIISSPKIILNYSSIKYDLFRLPKGFGASYIVSESFVQAVNQAGLTGVAFVPYDGKT